MSAPVKSPSPMLGLGLAIVLAGAILGLISILGLIFPDKAVLLHFPGIILGVFLLGAGVALMFGTSSKPPQP